MDGKEIGIGDLRMDVEGGKGKGLGLEARTKDSLEECKHMAPPCKNLTLCVKCKARALYLNVSLLLKES